MRKSRFTEEQVFNALQEHERGAKIADLCRKHGDHRDDVSPAGSGNAADSK